MRFVVITAEYLTSVLQRKTARLYEEWIFPPVWGSFDKTWLCCSFALIKVKILSSSLQQPLRAAKWFESAVLLHSALLWARLKMKEKNGISVGCVLWIWLHIPVVLLSISVLFCFASVVLACLHIVCLFVTCQLLSMQMQTNKGWHCKLGVGGR